MSRPLSYYLKLITSEYQGSANFISTLSSIIQILQDASTCVDDLPEDFDIDTAVGKQLDVLGVILGRPRTLPFQPTDGSSPTLLDAEYRTLLKATVGINQWVGQLLDIQSLWAVLFPDKAIVIIDNQNMSMDAITIGKFNVVERDMIRNGLIIPRPQAVKLNFPMFCDFAPVFGFDLGNIYIAGWDKGYWVTVADLEPPIFSYDMETASFAGYDVGTWD